MRNPFTAIWECFFPGYITLRIYMKSGNVIELKRVTNYTIKEQSLALTQSHCRGYAKLLVPTIDLSQIEAVVRVF